jgi:tetratricopeptide (TPR) repeat protein
MSTLNKALPALLTSTGALFIVFTGAVAPSFGQSSATPAHPGGFEAPAPRPTAAELTELKAQADAEPSDAKLRYNYAEALKRALRSREAAREYLAATELDPTFYHAYHQLSVCTSDKGLLDEAISRLNHLKDEKPKDLLLRVALSELYEKRAEYYLASKVLVEIIYLNAVPEKYLPKINNRVRYLQSKVKDMQALDKMAAGDATEDAGPAPLPEANLSRDLSISKVKEPRVMQGYGHATLLP